MDSFEKNEADEFILPGFRFHPTDEELVGFYLKKKIQQKTLSVELIKQLDIYKFDPWDLPKLAASGEKEWYFYCPRDRKYRNSARPNRVTGAGFWKATGTDRPIYSSTDGTCSASAKCIGLKKSLVFYKGRAAKGIKTDWMMHEFRLPSLVDHSTSKRYLDKNIPANDSWAICRIFKKTNSITQRAISQSWVSSLSETLIPKTIVDDSENTYFNSNYNISLTPNNVTTTSPMHYLCNVPNDPFQQSSSFSPSSNLYMSNSTDHLSSMLINMQSSMFEEFRASSQEHYNNDVITSITSPQNHQITQQSNLMISTKEDDEIKKAFLLMNPVMTEDINNVDDHSWSGAVQSIGFSPLGLPLNMSSMDAWKSNFYRDYSSHCPSEMSTSYSSY